MNGKMLRALLRSGDIQFARDYADAARSTPELAGRSVMTWKDGDGHPVHYRRGTSDLGLIYTILLKRGEASEYWIPENVPHRTILDIGGNIGVTSRYLAHRFPDANIHTFEPVPTNVELLRANTAVVKAINIHPFGLGSKSGSFFVQPNSDDLRNQGNFSLTASNNTHGVEVTVRAVPEVLDETGTSSVDIIKIDTEGAEWDILSAFPPEILSRVSWIYGELHTESIENPTAFKLLDYLSQWFVIDVHKPLHKKNFNFDACNKAIAGQFMDFQRHHNKARF